MNITLINQFYPPDVAPTGQVLHDVAARLAARGHRVTILCSRASYSGTERYAVRESRDGVDIIRVAAAGFGGRSHLRKLVSYASYLCAVGWRLLTCDPRPDLVFCLTTPPYVGLLGRCLAGLRGARHAHWIMDLYPDVMSAHGMLPAAAGTGSRIKRLAYRVLQGLTRLELGGSAMTLTLGPDMAERVEAYAAAPAHWVPLWGHQAVAGSTDTAAAAALRRERGWQDDDVVFLYSGNMGLGHRLEEFLETARHLAHLPDRTGPRPRFVFSGGGKRRSCVEDFREHHPEAGVELLDYAPRRQLAAHLGSADVLLASLEPSWAGCMLPSKLQSIFAAGKPVLFVGPSDCSMAQWIREAGAGWSVAADDPDGLLAAVREAANAETRHRCGRQAAEFAAEYFDMARNCDRICDLLEEAAAGKAAS